MKTYDVCVQKSMQDKLPSIATLIFTALNQGLSQSCFVMNCNFVVFIIEN